jgi:homoserine kinase
VSGAPRALDGYELRIPGSVSNLGPGFDALSVAVQVYLDVRVVEVRPEAPDTIETDFVGAAPAGENRIETAFRHARARLGARAPGVRIEVRSDIPTRAGLGSSGAATVAGLRLYQLLSCPISAEDLLALAADLEGHPDNAAASLLGGLTVSCQCDDGRVTARAWQWPSDLQIVAATPEAELETTHARRVLPDTISMRDAVFNLQRALLLVHSLSAGTYGDLREALRDRWHQPTRAPLVPGLAEVLALEEEAILGACLSGAGPSIVVFTKGRAAEAQARLAAIYRQLGVPSTIRVLAAHQPVEGTRTLEPGARSLS